MEERRIREMAELLLAAESGKKPIPPLTETDPDISVEEAYQIQLQLMELKKATGRVVVGKKIGLTSLAMQAMLGVKEPDYGHILHDMLVREGEKIKLTDLIAPRIEGEIAFVLNENLHGPGVTISEVLRCSAGIMPALEIIDSRIRDWKIKLADTVADNASSARVVLGGKITSPYNIDLRTVGMVMEKNGEIMATAAGAAVWGHPAQAVAWLANKLAQYGISLRKGEVILSGSLTAALPIAPADFFRADFGPLGDVKIKFI
ncbi:MAG: 2-keto-4-pentenoate hydratase [bacterium]